MGNEQHGLFGFHPDLQQLLLHQLAGLRVERCERLVHQQNLRIHDQRARKVHALLHAARQLVGIMMLEAGKADHLDEVGRTLLRLARSDVEAFQSVPYIVEYGPARQTSTRRSIRCTISTNMTPAATMVSTPTNTLSV